MVICDKIQYLQFIGRDGCVRVQFNPLHLHSPLSAVGVAQPSQKRVNVHTVAYQRSCRATITAGKGTANYDRKSIVNYDGPKRKMQREVAEQRIEKDAKMNLHSRERRGRGICKEKRKRNMQRDAI